MREIYRKTGLFFVIACLCLTISGFFSTGNAHASLASRPRALSFSPHIVVKLLPNSGHYFHHQYVARALVYGYGFDDCNCTPIDTSGTTPPSDCNSCTPTDTSGTTPPTDTSGTTPPTDTSGTTPPTDTSGTTPPCNSCASTSDTAAPSDTTPSTDCNCTTTTPSDVLPCASGCVTTHQDISDKVITTHVRTIVTTTKTTTNLKTTTTAVAHHSVDCTVNCGPAPSALPSCNRGCGSSSSAPSAHSAPSSPNTVSDTSGVSCPSYNSCDTSAGPSDSTCGTTDCSSSNCDCGTTANLQGDVPFSAPGVNFSRIPVNSYGEFRVGVNVRLSPRHSWSHPAFWATNSYNSQRSNRAFLSSYGSCCQ